MPESKMRTFEADTKNSLTFKPAAKPSRRPAETLEEFLASSPRETETPRDEGQAVNRLIAFLKQNG